MEIASTLIRNLAGRKNFCGTESNLEHYAATKILAQACGNYQVDVEEEVNWPGEITCYNCRFRRWNTQGFSCYKDFPMAIAEVE